MYSSLTLNIFTLPCKLYHHHLQKFSFSPNEITYPLNNNSYFPLLTMGNQHSNFCMNFTTLCTSHKQNHIMCVVIFGLCFCLVVLFFLIDLFHLVLCLQYSSMFKHVSEFPSFSKLNNIPLDCMYILDLIYHSPTKGHSLFLSFGYYE